MEEVKGIRMNGMDVMIDECFDRDNIWFEAWYVMNYVRRIRIDEMVCDTCCEQDNDGAHRM